MPLCCHGEHLLTFTSHVIVCPPPVLSRYRRYLHCEALVVSAQLVPLNCSCYHLRVGHSLAAEILWQIKYQSCY